MPQTARTIQLVQRPVGAPRPEDFRIAEVPLPDPGPGDVIVRIQALRLGVMATRLVGDWMALKSSSRRPRSAAACSQVRTVSSRVPLATGTEARVASMSGVMREASMRAWPASWR